MKILCICEQGNVRSVTLARLLKHRGHETIAAGTKRNSPETLEMLINWADKTYIVEKALADELPKNLKDKVLVFELGADIWGEAMHPDLVKLIEEKLK